ncbi:MAG: nickel pincer cofactor biosynthesis protein LarC [Deltaproteobacteria bacterium]|jgi:uncharacterized protein (TIGR00299 family) protein|nr:nickel pincer cofactor biosynthesis protein LarC [Deltaproteobacteria bacterium]
MHLYFDCRAGISGDMTLAALAHLGIDFGPLQEMFHACGIACTIELTPELRAAGPGMRADVAWSDAQPLRHPADLARVIRQLALEEIVRDRALAVVDALAEAEAHAHSIAVEEVHFHEVGAIDTLVDIVGAVWGLHRIGAERVIASPLPWFSGTVECEHGVLPLPAPATAYLMRNKPCFPSSATEELITPTGAAIIHVLAQSFDYSPPEGTPLALGSGYGSRPAPAGLRVWLIRPATEEKLEQITLLETHIDHLSGEELGSAITAIGDFDPAPLDLLWLPGLTKKNRPGGCLRVLCRPEHAQALTTAIFRHTHSLGIRRQNLERVILPRVAAKLHGPAGPLAAKSYQLEGHEYLRPEQDALSEAARDLGLGVPGVRLKIHR